MHRKTLCAMALAVTWSAPLCAQDADLARLREEVRQLKESYEQRIGALEERLQEAEARAGKSAPAAANTETAGGAPASLAASSPQAARGFSLDVSAILNGVYSNLSQNPDTYRINGFVPTGGEVGPGKRSFSLGESEIGLSANADHLFRGTLTASISPDNSSIDVEEGYIQTLGLSNGFSIKAGRFFSAVGYLNQIHAHAWDFTDMPLANKAFLGNQLAEDGAQIKWVAPTELYFDLGLELGRGRAFPASTEGGNNRNGIGSTNIFAHLGGDIGSGIAWQAGLSYLHASPQKRTYTDSDSLGAATVTNSFSGDTHLWVADGVLKWAPNFNPSDVNFKLQGEYFRRKDSGSLEYNSDPADSSAAGAAAGTLSDSYRSKQSGWYLQGVYQFVPMWRVGYRYDRLNPGVTTLGLVDSGVLSAADFPILGAYKPTRNTLMADWSPSEFSRFRLQVARDKARMGQPDNQIFLQYIVSLGAHGAHKF